MQEAGSRSKIVITDEEVTSVALPADALGAPKLPRAIPIWARLVVLPLALVPPLLAIVALVLRLALRAAAPRTQQAWHAYLMSLLIAATFVSVLVTVALVSYFPAQPHAISLGLSELDQRMLFPSLPTESPMTGVEVAQRLKPLVMVASPSSKSWFGSGEIATSSVGAALLLHSTAGGHLFVTAWHVADAAPLGKSSRMLLATPTGGWAGADVVGWNKSADLALLWVPRHSGISEFVQPLTPAEHVQEGSRVYVIGHPQGLNYTISDGIVSRASGNVLQVSAPVSPGNSGGPVYDERGNLLGVVVGKMDRAVVPNAENLNFATSASILREMNGWDFNDGGRNRLEAYLAALKSANEKGTK